MSSTVTPSTVRPPADRPGSPRSALLVGAARSVETATFFFPVWNEEAIIARTVAAAIEAGDRLVEEGEVNSYEILLVDDASTDTTSALVDALAEADHRIRVVHHDVNRKLGGTLKTGFAQARGDVVLYTDADLPFDLIDVVRAMRLLRVYEADIVSAYRLDRTGEGPRRAAYSYAYNLLVRVALQLRVRDVNFAFKLIRRRVLEQVPLRSEGSFIDAELLSRAEAAGFTTIQFGVDYFPRTRGQSTLSSPGVIGTILREMASLAPDLRAQRRRR